MDKIDYKREWKHLYSPSNKVINIVDVPAMNFLRIDGMGNPENDQSFKDASEALVRLSYTIKFIIKRSELGIDYISMPLEALWWTEERKEFSLKDKNNLKWTLCIMQPEYVTKDTVKEGIERTRKKKEMHYLDKVKFDTFTEGLCTQLMHIGPYADEDDSINKLQAYLEVNGYELNKSFHEIYLGDPRRARPENLKTIVRMPIRKIGC